MTTNSDFAEATRALLKTHGALLLSLAKGSIDFTLKENAPAEVHLEHLAPQLAENGACFVTLRKDNLLRGCIGSPEAWRPLASDVVANANRAAFHDPRFASLQQNEAKGLDLHISVLSPPEPFEFNDEAEFYAKLQAGVDGLSIEDSGQKALFLPSVWEQLPEPKDFIRHLKIKAGLNPENWSETLTAKRFIAAGTGADWADISLPD
ncbi:MAG: AMMECR1 domain-containing protein [Rhodospirillaceae bacterium]|nr:MAG: AMMECR1 domain-containing protein [Rhodospirillaceae bacterium]